MKKYIFKPYDPIYPKLFNKEKGRLKKFLGEDVLIEHIGSTSIVGMGGKGIIDIAVAANSKDDLSNVSSILKMEQKIDGFTEGRFLMKKGSISTLPLKITETGMK